MEEKNNTHQDDNQEIERRLCHKEEVIGTE